LEIALLLMFFSHTIGLPLHAAKIVAEPFPPARFTSLYIERDEKRSATVVQLMGDAISYQVTSGGKVVESIVAHPTGDDWFKFIQGLNSAKVYNWTPKYWYPGQGPSWAIDLVMDDRKFASEGANEYPLNGDEAKPAADPLGVPSIPFQLFWQAVLTLVGKQPPPAAPK
jgi:hypothetical protein